MRKILIVLSCLGLFTSCAATFSRRIIKNRIQKLNENNLKQLNGIFTIFPDKSFEEKNDSIKYISKLTGLKNSLYYFVHTDRPDFDTIARYKVRLNAIENNAITFTFIKNEKSFDSITITGKIKRNGMFHLDNKFLKCNGIPYLFGGCTSHKARIGITKSNDLIINEAYDVEGAILIIFGDGYMYNSAYNFKRLD